MSELERCQSGFQVLSQLLSYGLDRLWLCSRWLNWIADPAVLTISWALPKDVTKKWGGKRFSLTENKVNIIMVGTYSNGFNSKHLETFVGRSCHSWPYPWLLWPPTNVCGHEHCNPHCYQWIFLALSYSGPLQSFGELFPYSQMSSASSSWANLNSSWLIGAASAFWSNSKWWDLLGCLWCTSAPFFSHLFFSSPPTPGPHEEHSPWLSCTTCGTWSASKEQVGTVKRRPSLMCPLPLAPRRTRREEVCDLLSFREVLSWSDMEGWWLEESFHLISCHLPLAHLAAGVDTCIPCSGLKHSLGAWVELWE